MLRSTTVTVTDVITEVAGYPTFAGSQLGSVLVHNNSANIVYVGGDDVTTTNGVPVAASTSISIPVMVGEKIYAICAAALSSNVRVLRSQV